MALGQATGKPELTPSSALVANREAGNDLFLPIIMAGRMVGSTDNKPLPPDSYPSDQSTPPILAVDPTATSCASFIDFTNFSDETLYIFWVGANNEEFLYKILDSGRHYWQHTYRLNEWRIRDDAARLLRTVVVEDCENRAVEIFVDDLPPCGGILNIGLFDINTERPITQYATLEDGMTIDLAQLPPVIIRISAQDTVESIEVVGGGSVVALNELPYHFPPNGNHWSPKTGLTTLIFSAYRKDNAVGKVCDSVELTLLVFNDATPTPTVSMTATPTPTATSTLSGTVTSTPTPVTPTPLPTTPSPTTPPTTPTVTPTSTPTPVSTPTPTMMSTSTPTMMSTSTPTPTLTATATPTATPTVPVCQGQIESIQLYDLTVQAPIAGYSPLRPGTTIVLDELPEFFNIDTTVSGAPQSLLYVVNGIASLENALPFRYPGGDTNPWLPTPGAYTIRATAYEFTDATGAICDTLSLDVTVVESLATATPTATATAAATPTPTATATPGDTCLGDQTWLDQNEDGIHNSGEPGIDGLDLYLWADDNRDGLPDRIVNSTTTTVDGFYEFCELQSTMVYLIEFGMNPQCRFTLSDQGTDEAVDSDADALHGLTAPLQVAVGQMNTSVDAGYICSGLN